MKTRPPNTESTASKFALKKLLQDNPSKNSILVVFGAAWCPDTKRYRRKVIPRFKDTPMIFLNIDIEGEERGRVIRPELKKRYDITRYPTLVLFSREIEIARAISEGTEDEQIKDTEELIRKIPQDHK